MKAAQITKYSKDLNVTVKEIATLSPKLTKYSSKLAMPQSIR